MAARTAASSIKSEIVVQIILASEPDTGPKPGSGVLCMAYCQEQGAFFCLTGIKGNLAERFHIAG